MKTEQAFMNLGTNKFFFHYVFGKKIKDFAQDHKHGFCAEEFCFKEVLACKGIISVEESLGLKFYAFIILAKPNTTFSNDVLEIFNGEGLLIKLEYNDYEKPAYTYTVLSYQCLQNGTPIYIEEITEE